MENIYTVDIDMHGVISVLMELLEQTRELQDAVYIMYISTQAVIGMVFGALVALAVIGGAKL